MRMQKGLVVLMVWSLVVAACGGGISIDPLVEAAELRAAQAAELPASVPSDLADDSEPGAPAPSSNPEDVDGGSGIDGESADEATSSTSSTSTTVASSDESPSEVLSEDTCGSSDVGYRVELPTGWSCSQVTTPVAGGSAFSLATEDGTLTVTIGRGEATFACDLFDACDQDPIDLSDQFDTSIFVAGGITEIAGPHIDGDAYAVIVSNGGISSADEDLIAAVLDSTTAVG